jgi:hypothetical protein
MGCELRPGGVRGYNATGKKKRAKVKLAYPASRRLEVILVAVGVGLRHLE